MQPKKVLIPNTQVCHEWCDLYSPGTTDIIIWTLSTNGCYSVGSAYKAQFLGLAPCSFESLVWKTWEPPKCRFFAWLVVQNRLWTSDRLPIIRWPQNPLCQLCKNQGETAKHILFKCRCYRQIWQATTSWLSHPSLVQDMGTGWQTMLEYWQAIIKAPTTHPKGLKSAVTLLT